MEKRVAEVKYGLFTELAETFIVIKIVQYVSESSLWDIVCIIATYIDIISTYFCIYFYFMLCCL